MGLAVEKIQRTATKNIASKFEPLKRAGKFFVYVLSTKNPSSNHDITIARGPYNH